MKEASNEFTNKKYYDAEQNNLSNENLILNLNMMFRTQNMECETKYILTIRYIKEK